MIDAIRRPAWPRASSRRRAGGSFEAKVVWLCLVSTIAAMTCAFAIFQWQDWRSDRADLAADQTALARTMAPQLTLERGDAALVNIARGMARGSEQTIGAAWFPASGESIQLLAPKAGGPPLRPTAGVVASAAFDAGRLTVSVPYIVGRRRVGEQVLEARDDEPAAGEAAAVAVIRAA